MDEHDVAPRTVQAETLMPMTGYDDEAQKVTLRTGTRTWRLKVGLLMGFAASVAGGAGVASLFR